MSMVKFGVGMIGLGVARRKRAYRVGLTASWVGGVRLGRVVGLRTDLGVDGLSPGGQRG
jgi:hypothetical protein